MKAEIFFRAGQEAMASRLAALLRGRGYAVEERSIAPSPGASDVVQLATRYVKLLQAAIPPGEGLRLSVVSQDFAGYRIYLRVYFLFYGFSKSFQERGLDAFFPALALGERMVLVPEGLKQQLAADRETLPVFTPFEHGGVLEARFDDETALAPLVERVDRMARADLLRELAAYASFQGGGEPDLQQASRDLGFEPSFLRETLAAGAGERGFYRRLACTLDRAELPLGRYSRATLTLENGSGEPLAGLVVSIAGPVRVLPSRLEVDLPANGRRDIPLALLPEAAGDIPLEVLLALPQDRILAGWLPVHHLWVRCE
jgi:hypothetical protein